MKSFKLDGLLPSNNNLQKRHPTKCDFILFIESPCSSKVLLFLSLHTCHIKHDEIIFHALFWNELFSSNVVAIHSLFWASPILLQIQNWTSFQQFRGYLSPIALLNMVNVYNLASGCAFFLHFRHSFI